MMARRSLMMWIVYAVFVAGALYLNWHDRMLEFGGTRGVLKLAVWAALLAFLAYSFECSRHENLVKTVRTMGQYYWGRQIMTDLYLGLFLGFIVIYLNEGWLVLLIWLIPMLIYANLVFLLYFAIHFDSIADKLLL